MPGHLCSLPYSNLGNERFSFIKLFINVLSSQFLQFECVDILVIAIRDQKTNVCSKSLNYLTYCSLSSC